VAVREMTVGDVALPLISPASWITPVAPLVAFCFRFVKAPEAVLEAVPPSAIARSVMPVIVPALIVALLNVLAPVKVSVPAR